MTFLDIGLSAFPIPLYAALWLPDDVALAERLRYKKEAMKMCVGINVISTGEKPWAIEM